MVPRRRARRNPVFVTAVPVAVALVVGLSGCSPLSLFANWGGGGSPTASASSTPEAGPTTKPAPSRTPSGTATPGCIDRVISAPGTYRVDDCQNLTVAGSDIVVTAARIGTLTVMGDSLQVYTQSIGTLVVKGDLNNLQANDNINDLQLTGSRNMITCHGSMETASVTGDDNTVLVDGGVDGDVENNGQRNAIGGQP